MAHGGILVFSLPLLVVLMGFLLSHAEGVDTAKTTSHPPLPIAVLLPGYNACSSSAPGRVTVKGTTDDQNGYFLIQTNKVTNYGAHKCRVFLVSSPLSYCNVPVYPAGKRSGSRLIKVREEQIKSWVLANKHSTLRGLLHLLRPKEALVPVVPERDLSSDLEIGCSYADREIFSKNNSVLDI